VKNIVSPRHASSQPVYRLQPQCPTARDTFRVIVQPRATPAISGIVTNLDTGTPVSGAVVTLLPVNRGHSTDSLGRFAMDSVAPGDYVIATRGIGYEPRVDSLEVSTGSALTVRLPLEPVYLERCPTVERVRVR
jgi:hypothetical protein